MKLKNKKLTEAFVKLMSDMGATFIDVTLKKKPKLKKDTKQNYLPKIEV